MIHIILGSDVEQNGGLLKLCVSIVSNQSMCSNLDLGFEHLTSAHGKPQVLKHGANRSWKHYIVGQSILARGGDKLLLYLPSFSKEWRKQN